ncbi:MAG TPA: hypothetical protein VFR86_29390, partial [Burkholderiaceae bacterium]|nr:hypothetical protein [Burkholderiaceae bacterium]
MTCRASAASVYDRDKEKRLMTEGDPRIAANGDSTAPTLERRLLLWPLVIVVVVIVAAMAA